MKHIFYLLVVFFLAGCSGTDGVDVKSASLQGVEATIREDVAVGSTLSGELYIRDAPANLADVQISLAGSGNSYFGISVSQGSTSDTYVGEVKLLRSLEGRGGDKLHLTAWARLNGQSLSAPVVIDILNASVENQPPIAKIDKNKNEKSIILNKGESYTLSSDFSSDNDDGIVYCKWSDEGGTILNQKNFNPSLKKLSSSNLCKIDLSGLSAGNYDYTLTIRDKSGAIDSNIAHITIKENHTPTVSINEGDQNIEVNSILDLSVTADDEDGDSLTYEWIVRKGDSIVSTKSGSESEFSYKFNEIGNYTVEVIVKDTDNSSSSDTINITVRALDNIPPIARIGMSYMEGDQEEQTINGAVGANIFGLETYYSSDSDGSIVHCSWENDIGELIKESNDAMCDLSNLKFSDAGTYNYTLSVTDNDGAIDTNIVHIVIAPNIIPTVKIAGEDRSVEANTTIHFTGLASDDDGDTIDYWWSFGLIGSNSSSSTSIERYSEEVSFDHKFNEVGKYFVKLVVEDAKGAKADSRIEIDVTSIKPVIVSDAVIKGSLMWEDTNHTREAKDLTPTTASNYCKDLRLGGFSNWRLPHSNMNSDPYINELATIVAGSYGNNTQSAIKDGFVAIYPRDNLAYWTDEKLSSASHVVEFFTGGENFDGLGDDEPNVSVRCVRDIQ